MSEIVCKNCGGKNFCEWNGYLSCEFCSHGFKIVKESKIDRLKTLKED